ncbi:MAG: ATP-binding protein, partial [Desulfurococcales archaeon]|nr:ATP-binding protein [Desulfurococcales archaeon]
MGDSTRIATFPFTAIVGLDDAKTALLAAAVNPLIGGVLLRGDKGTGKTTLVRSLANLLPEIKVVADCPFNCDPENPSMMCDNCYRRWSRGEKLPVATRKMRVVDLPLSVTPDRLIGTIDVEKFLREGVKAVSPGLLAEANRNILYIDEVNLLDDYIADLILDAAAYGWNVIEREHVSFKHPSRFILVGSMNPEEGELRPQLLDRFGLVVDVNAPMDPELRAEIVRRVEEYSDDPVSFYKKYEPLENDLREKIAQARKILCEVVIDDELLRAVAEKIAEM